MPFKSVLAFIFLTGCLFAESTSGSMLTNTSTSTLTTVTAVLPDLKPELEAQGKEIDRLKAAQAKLENADKELNAKYEVLNKANTEVLASLKNIDAGMKLLGDRVTASEKALEILKVKIDSLNEEIAAINKKADADRLILSGLKTQSESFKVKLDIAQDDIKVRSDEIKALKDALSIIRSNINSNITDTIELKKTIGELKAKESGKPAEGIMSWEYLGIVTSGVAVLALVLSIAK